MSEITTKAHVLSNESYAVLLTARGGGYSALRGYALTRWQPDPTTPAAGIVLYLRDRETGEYWSTLDSAVRVKRDYVELCCDAADIELSCEVGVLRDAAAERRRIRISNRSKRPRRLELTTYTELCLNTLAADAGHPAFSKLFVQTAHDATRAALIGSRRLRSPDDRPLWVAQRLTGADGVEFETDREQFIGRTRSLREPRALRGAARLSGRTGAVLDPIFSWRAALELDARGKIELELFMCAADTRAEIERMLDDPPDKALARESNAMLLGLPEAWSAGIAFEHPPADAPSVQIGVRAPAECERTLFGDFSEDGRSFVMQAGGDLEPTPQPWTNVVANEQGGFLISEMGAGFTWTANSRENRLTPWSNDPVGDPFGEALYLRDEKDGAHWSLLPGPAPAGAVYEVTHGWGYSTYALHARGLQHETTLFVPRSDPVKIVRVQLTNTGKKSRQLSLYFYAQLVLGGLSAQTRAAVTTSFADGVIYARNAERGEFSQRVAFASACHDAEVMLSATGSRRSFAGPDGSLASPAALSAPRLSHEFGSDLDPCAALQLRLELDPDATFTCAFLLGEAADDAAARECLARYATLEAVAAAFTESTAFWQELLSGVQVRTPVPALDLMFNGWLAYQNLACRMWGRSAFYQSGGAFGFRDQLQDSSALLYLDPAITREQILLHASHQFVEGDVLHWWHPPASKGIRTRFSDDLLWLPQITDFYISRTGDAAILDEEIGFVTAEQLEEAEDERFVWPQLADETAPLYEHCCRALDRSLTRGMHGLPLIGVGDWNDGMNRVGRKGRGESVWLGFFLFDILSNWIPICEERGDRIRARRYRAYRRELHAALNEAGWDGAWYRRAYYDDGAPLGSAQNDECRIDALAQAWAVISRAAPGQRAGQALAAMREQLVDEAAGIIRLLTPAFDRTPHDPGYIKGYVPGVRENGGQYTHAALWAVRALAEHGEHEAAARLLEMLSPVTRGSNGETYRGEPYVIAADVYGEPPHVGRAGWTWYTGSAGWMYRVLLESILGFELVAGKTVRLRPCLPAAWPGYSLRYRFADGTMYNFEVARTDQRSSTSAGEVADGAIVIPLELDGREHTVRIRAGADVRPRYRPRSSEAPLLRTTSA